MQAQDSCSMITTWSTETLLGKVVITPSESEHRLGSGRPYASCSWLVLAVQASLLTSWLVFAVHRWVFGVGNLYAYRLVQQPWFSDPIECLCTRIVLTHLLARIAEARTGL